jgi:hypothetical protein
MPKKSSLTSVHASFIAAVNSAGSLYSAIEPFADKSKAWDAIHGWEPIHHAQARRVIALAFMHLVSACKRGRCAISPISL